MSICSLIKLIPLVPVCISSSLSYFFCTSSYLYFITSALLFMHIIFTESIPSTLFLYIHCYPCLLNPVLPPFQPEGTRQTVNRAMLIDLRAQPSFSTTVNITTPPNIVNGSKAISVTLIGRCHVWVRFSVWLKVLFSLFSWSIMYLFCVCRGVTQLLLTPRNVT